MAESGRERFNSRLGALLAMAGCAVGLGNVWRFPYVAGENGGSSFILVYLLFSLLICVPIIIAETVMGRRSHSNPFGAVRKLAPRSGSWRILGLLSVVTAFVILPYYSVVGGWTIQYFFQSCTLDFDGEVTADSLHEFFNFYVSSPWKPLIGEIIFVLLAAKIVDSGVSRGIERFCKIMMPSLFFIMIIIAVRSVTLPGAMDGVRYLFKFDVSTLTPDVCLAALGQAFYSLSVGMGALMTYASFMSDDDSIMGSATRMSVIDLLFAMISGLAIMPAVFAFGYSADSGPGLVFSTLPLVFSKLRSGVVLAIIFFLALVVAALTSAVALFQVVVTYLKEERGMNHRPAVVATFFITLFLCILCSLSFGPLKDFTVLGRTIFDIFDAVSANVLLPLGGLLIVLFVGWKMKRSDVWSEATNNGRLTSSARVFKVVYFVIRYVAPVAIAAVFIGGLL